VPVTALQQVEPGLGHSSGRRYDADTAERYGWVNRSIPDAELDAFVERFATRVASFGREAMSIAKQRLNHLGGIPDPADLLTTQAEFFRLLQRPEAQALVADLFRRGLQTRGDLELNLGKRVGPQPNGNGAATP
jgi:enoyl-CoA hydratase/carnithine racemase